MFAIITVALISGAIADRVEFWTWLLFAGLWATLVYFPVAHWVFSFDGVTGRGGGWIANVRLGAHRLRRWHRGAHQRRCGRPRARHRARQAARLAAEPMRPHNLPFVMLGAGLLWFGWFGFNAGSALGADGIAGVAFINTLVATAAAMLGWLLVERIRDGKPTTPRRRLRRRRRPGRDHPGLRLRSTPLGAHRHRPDRRCRCAPWPSALKYKLRLRRLARRRRRPPGRWPGRHPADRPLRHHRASTRWARDGLFYGGGADQLWQPGRRRRSP